MAAGAAPRYPWRAEDMFTHLHVNTEYSPLDGMSKIPDHLDRA